MPVRSDALPLALKVVVYVALYFAAAYCIGPLLYWAGGYLVAITATGLLCAVLTNTLCLRIYEQRGIAAIGLESDRASLANLALGCLGGFASAALVMAGPLVVRVARIQHDPGNQNGAGSFLFVTLILLFGSAGEELLFRGFGFQVMLRTLGPWTTVLPVGVLFALMHAGNPSANWLGLANTIGFGVLFGYAFLRSHDIWLPIGLHFGWNFALSLGGVNVSGLEMRLTQYSVHWSAGAIWSGGSYGPEASILTSAVLFLLGAYLRKAPIRRQKSALIDGPSAPAEILNRD